MMVYCSAFIILWSTSAFSQPSSYEQGDHTQLLFNDISSLHLKEKFSDVVLVVGNERMHAHRLVLASHSEYFSDLFYGSRKESHEHVVTISDVSLTSFKILLEYTYTGRVNLSTLENEIITALFFDSHYFGFLNFQLALSDYYRRNINVDNACSLFTGALVFELKKLEEESISFIDKNAMEILQYEDFLSLSPVALQHILNRDSFDAYEMDIFCALCRWITNRQDSLDLDFTHKVLSTVRYPLISADDLESVVSESQLVNPEMISDALEFKQTKLPHEYKYRGRPGLNFVNFCQITSSKTDYVTNITLHQPSTINYIEFNLSYIKFKKNKDVGIYSYYVEVSTNQNVWMRVIDHLNYPCRSTQRLWLYPRLVQYIRIVGTKSMDKKKVNVFIIEYKRNKMHLVDIKNRLVAPKYNVALRSMDATVIKEYDFSNSAMLESDYRYRFARNTRHLIKSGCIVVQLAQPYVLSSMRMLIWDKAGGIIRYTIEASNDNKKWDKIVESSNELSRSWQLLQFEPRAIVYIRIRGVYSSVSEYFCCELLEAPAPPAQVALNTNVVVVNRDELNETNITIGESSTQAPAI